MHKIEKLQLLLQNKSRYTNYKENDIFIKHNV